MFFVARTAVIENHLEIISLFEILHPFSFADCGISVLTLVIAELQKTLETEKKRTEKLKGDLAKTEEDLAGLRKVSYLPSPVCS